MRVRAGLPVLLLVLAAAAAGGAGGAAAPAGGGGGSRSVSFWWDGRDRREPDAHKFLSWVKAHASIVDSVMFNCGTRLLDDGSIGGGVSDACLSGMAGCRELGVGVELWLGESRNLTAQRVMFARWEVTADALVDLVRKHELQGVNFDLEPHGSVAADAERYARFLSRVKPRLNAAGARLTADAAPFAPMIANLTLLAPAVDKVMYMHTYFAKSEAEWIGRLDAATAALGPGGAPKFAAGLAGFSDNNTRGWADTPQSAVDRVCWLMHRRVPEIAVFRISLHDVPEHEVWPLPWWAAPLAAYRRGEECTPPGMGGR